MVADAVADVEAVVDAAEVAMDSHLAAAEVVVDSHLAAAEEVVVVFHLAAAVGEAGLAVVVDVEVAEADAVEWAVVRKSS